MNAAEHWSQLVAHRGGPGQNPGGGRAAAGGPDFGSMADRLMRDGRRDMTSTPAFEAVAGALGPERSVLDIGAGTGRYSLPLAAAGCRVQALEPSPEMRSRLEGARAELGEEVARRVRVIAAPWPAPAGTAEPAEVALASLVIHFCADAPGFIRAMAAAASRRCVIAIRADQHHPLVERLWPRFHPNLPHPAQPVADDLLWVLDEMGIRPEVRVHAPARPYGHYGSPEEAVRQISGLLRLDGTAAEALHGEIRGLLRPEGDGWVVDGPPVREALVSWAP
jgi:SAM-dependent methyltransferase